MSYSLPLDYIDVAERIRTFREAHPEGSLQQVSLDFVQVNGRDWVVYTAAAFRTPDDPRPGQGTAWELVPGKTNFTKDSEVQNAETAAWGRAIVAVLAAETKRGIASAEEVRNRADSVTDPQFITDAELAISQATNTDELDTVREFIKTGVDDGKCSQVDRTRLIAQFSARKKVLDES